MAGLNDLPQTPQNPANYGAGPQGPTAGPPPLGPSGPADREPNRAARMWGMFAHLAAVTGFITGGIGCIVGPLVVWLIKKEDYPFVDDQGKEAVNFQITMLIYAAAALLLAFLCIGFILLPVVGVVDIVFTILATIKANDGVRYRYPKWLNLRLIK
jgi:uncharacterized Tic20 family protein